MNDEAGQESEEEVTHGDLLRARADIERQIMILEAPGRNQGRLMNKPVILRLKELLLEINEQLAGSDKEQMLLGPHETILAGNGLMKMAQCETMLQMSE